MRDTKIYINTYKDYLRDSKRRIISSKKHTMLDYGVGNNTLENYSLPSETFNSQKHLFKFDADVGQYYLEV